MAHERVQSDKGIGFTVLFSLLALGGAAAMLAAPGQFAKALGFGVAMLAAVVAVVASQAYD